MYSIQNSKQNYLLVVSKKAEAHFLLFISYISI